ncbi:MAG: DUF1583 domain-containing protein [Planctomycetes bacterium]|nr:DUF1583 domain-containing protein [Planctomycetota bacterium]
MISRGFPVAEFIRSVLWLTPAVVSFLALPTGILHAAEASAQQTVNAEAPAAVARGVAEDRVVEFASALEALGRAVNTPEFKRPGPQVATACQMLFRLNALPAGDRYRLLKSWTLPTKERLAVRHFVGVIPDAPPPRVFLQESLPPLEEPVISTIVLLVDAAREADRLAELATELRPLVERNVPGAASLDQLVAVVRDGGGAVRPRLSAAYDEAEVGRLLLDAQPSASFNKVLWGYRSNALAVIERTGAALKPSADPGLKHWVPVDLAAASNSNPFSSTSWWIALDDRIGHVCSPWVDHLVFAYPLRGTFEISCESFNGLWSEANVGFGGLMFEAWNQGSSRNQVFPINAHESLLGPKAMEFRNQFNRVTIRVAPDYLEALGNNDVLLEDFSPSTTSPFLLLRTTWLSAFRKLRILGEVTIPREVSLLSGRRMEGWMTSYYNESQPTELSVRMEPDKFTRTDDPNAHDWSTIDSVLHGRRFADLNSPNRQSGYQHGESWAYYHRPLRADERIQYEFFYHPGDEGIEVHPTLDRIAFLLRPEGVKLHWLTANRTTEQGEGWIATDNEVEEPANRRGPTPLLLKSEEWNTAAVEIRGGEVRVELNGQLVYERPLEANCGTRFGLYHDRTRTSVKVRNVVLSGDWPEWSKELSTNLLERTKPLPPTDIQAIRTILTPRLTAD